MPLLGTACILLVEDSLGLVESLTRGLGEAHFEVRHSANAAGAWTALDAGGVDALILDLGLPDLDGLKLLAQVRARGLALPILVLTARESVRTRVEALNAGADDYVVKPFAFEELLARVRSLLRRAAAPRWSSGGVGGLQLREGHVLIEGREVQLSPREHGLLQVLLSRRDQTVTRKELLRDAFGYDFDPGTNVIDVHVSHLRTKISGSGVEIETVRGFGYRLRS